jgi:hypothetical protein
MGEPGSRTHDIFACIAIDPVTRGGGETGNRRLAILPGRKKTGDNPVARLELLNAGTNRLDNAGAIGKRNAPGGAGKAPVTTR